MIFPFIFSSLIGTHDSASYFLDFNSKIYNINPIISDAITIVGGHYLHELVYDWSKAQSYNISTQLASGVRYLDLRLIQIHDIWYTCHGLLGSTLDNIVQQIILSEKFPLIELTTYSQPDDTLCNSIEILSNVYTNFDCNFTTLDASNIINTFANTPHLPKMVQYNKDIVKTHSLSPCHHSKLLKLSWTLTPNVFTMMESWYKDPKTLLDLAEQANKEFYLFADWIIVNNYTWPDIIIFDNFFSD